MLRQTYDDLLVSFAFYVSLRRYASVSSPTDNVGNPARAAETKTKKLQSEGAQHAFSVPVTPQSPTRFGDVVQRLTEMLRGIDSLYGPNVDERLLFRLTRALTGMVVVTDPNAKPQIDLTFSAWDYFQSRERAAADKAALSQFGEEGDSCSNPAGVGVLSWYGGAVSPRVDCA